MNNIQDLNLFLDVFIIYLSKHLIFFDGWSKLNHFNLRPRDAILKDYDLKDKCRRKLHWIFFGQFNSQYKSFENFKEKWDNNLRFKLMIKDKYLEKRRQVIIFKKTLMWFISPKNR